MIDGPVHAITFVVNPHQSRYAGALDEKIAEVISSARGSLGTCADYLWQTMAHLEELGLGTSDLNRSVSLQSPAWNRILGRDFKIP